MADYQVFWSYVHADNDAVRNRITLLAEDLQRAFEMQTGEKLQLFVDKDAIEWGEGWRQKVDSGLTLAAFFVPIMTPRYFQSPQCRRELQYFAKNATRLGGKERVAPIHYVDVPAFGEDSPEDELVALVKTYQWEDWRELRLFDPSAEPYCRAVARLAKQLADSGHKMGAQAAATEVMSLMGDKAIPYLVDLVDTTTDPEIRRSGIEALGRVGVSAIRYLGTVTNTSTIPEVRRLAIEAIGRNRQPAIPALQMLAGSEDAQIRQWAIEALGRIGEPAFPALRMLAESEDVQLRQWAIEALGRMRVPAIRPLMSLARDRNLCVKARVAAIEALERMETTMCIPPLKSLTTDPCAEIQRAATEALHRIGLPISE